MIKYFIYCRKSSEEEERQILSIEAQLTELREFARQNGLWVVQEFTESKTAKEPGREIFNQTLSEIEKGSASGILAWNPDRLARNSVDGGRIIYLVDTGKIQSLKFPTFWFEPTPQGKFILSVAFGQAKYYTDNLSENILRGLRQKIRRGELPAKAPLGYFNEPRLRTIEPHLENFHKMKKVLELFATGNFTLTELQRKMFSLGLVGQRNKRPPHLSTLQSILTNPFYYGMFKYRGELHQGGHKPMISKKLFDRIQQVIKEKTRPRKRKERGFLFLGFATCGECGYCITAEKHVKKSGLEFVYYRCTKKAKSHKCAQNRYIREEKLASQVKAICQKVSLPDEWRNKFLSKIEGWKKEESHSSTLFAQNLKEELTKVKTKISRLTDIYLDGMLELSEFQEKKNGLMQKKADLEEKLRDFERKGNHWLELTRNWINEANQAKNLVLEENVSGMKDFLKTIGSNRRLAAGALSVSFKKPWFYLAQTTTDIKNLGQKNRITSKWWTRAGSNR